MMGKNEQPSDYLFVFFLGPLAHFHERGCDRFGFRAGLLELAPKPISACCFVVGAVAIADCLRDRFSAEPA